MVIAGPGTGKTQILATRIGNILDKGLAFAENILCLTYTDSGTVAMRNRLIDFIGPEAYKIPIHTFHSFCNSVILDHNEWFGYGEMQLISPLEEKELIEQLIDNFSENHPLKKWNNGVYYYSNALLSLFSTMKSEYISQEKIENISKEYIASLPHNPDFIYKRKSGNNKKGDLNKVKIEKEEEKYTKLIAAAKEFKNYEKLKTGAGLFDYQDMIIYVLNAFEKHEWLLAKYQEKFQYFLVDEYQDTNGSQNKILEFLYTYWDNPNVFVVGDDDQSIFKFQGANLENMVNFYKNTIAKQDIKEQKQRIIVLKENYRSTQQILETSAQSININQHRLVNTMKNLSLDKHLNQANSFTKEQQQKVKVVAYENNAFETAHICKQIQHLISQGVSLNKMAVLYKNHKHAEEIFKCLNQEGISVNLAKSVNILHEPLTNSILNILKYIYYESKYPHSREDLLFEMLLSPFFNIDSIEVSRLQYEMRFGAFKESRNHWREVLYKKEILNQESQNELIRVSHLIEKWQKDIIQKPLQLFFQTLIDDINCIAYIEKQNERVWLMQELSTLFDFIKDINAKNPNISIYEFLEVIEKYKKYNLEIPYTQLTYDVNAVHLSTLHKAKGLEFDYVFMISCSAKNWEHKRKISNPFSMPPGILITQEVDDEIEDLRRLFFVGITRAKFFLQLSYYLKDSKGNDHLPSQFIKEIESSNDVDFSQPKFEDSMALNFAIYQLKKENVYPKLLKQSLLNHRLQGYHLSVTHLNNYLKCPIQFYYNNFIQLPQAKNSYAAFGLAIHQTIEKLFLKMKENEGVFPSNNDFVKIAISELYKQQECFTKIEFEQKKEYAKMFLPRYYKYYVNTWNKNVSFEKRLKGLFKDINLTGIIDKIEYEAKGINLIDYKTGKLIKKKLSKPKPNTRNKTASFEDEYGGNYWRQAVFYQILVKHNNDHQIKATNINNIYFDFVEPDTKGNFTLQKIIVDAEDEKIVKQQIEDTWSNIQKLNFKGCGKEDCYYCQNENLVHIH